MISKTNTVLAIGIIVFMAFGSHAQESDDNAAELTAQEMALLSQYRGDVQLPDSLVRAYAQFTETTADATEEQLKAFTLPHSVDITTASRVQEQVEYGTAMNLPFLKTRFQPRILNLRKESEHCYLIRTGSSYIRYVETASNEWKIYNFGDKPIE